MEPTPARTLLACQSWADFHREVRPFDNKVKGDCFELLTREFLLLDTRYDFKHIWSTHREVPEGILKKLNLFDRDLTGIDFVAETQTGRFWAIQCKYRHDEGTLTREEAKGLIAGKNRAPGQFELGLLCTTANGRSAHLAKEPGIEYLMGDVWRGLDSEFFRRLHDHLAGAEPPPPARIDPRPDQMKAIESVREHFATESRGKIIMPCATGKTLVGFWCAEALQARSVLIAVPNLSLVKQLLRSWTEQSAARGRQPRWIVVCSDDSVADRGAGQGHGVNIEVAKGDLGVKIDTKPSEISGWLRANRDAPQLVVFTTYQSGHTLATAVREAGSTFDVGIFDEAHRTTGRKGRGFSHLLSDDNVRIDKRIFMTATPRIYSGTDRDDVVSMDDATKYGTEAFKMTFFEAMDQGIIPNLEIVTVAASGKDVQRILADRRFIRLRAEHKDTVIRVEDLVSALALRKAMKKYGIRRTLGFYSSRRRCHLAREIQLIVGELLPEYGPLDLFHVDGEMTAGQRSKKFQAFEESEHALITNVRVFVEGVDCPTMDAVIFADPRQSTIDIVQGVGRAMRSAPRKETGFAIIPVQIDENGKPSDEAYSAIVKVVCALGSENEVVLDYFTAIAQGKPWAGRRVFEFLAVEVGMSVDVDAINRAIAVRTYDRTTLRKTIEDARALAKAKGFEILSENFTTTQGRYAWRCSIGHEWEAKYNDIQQGGGCPYCAGKARKTIEDAVALAKERGFRFLSSAMSGNQNKYLWQCSNEHEWNATYGNIQQGSGCPQCARSVPKTIEDAQALAKERGFTFRSPQFAGVRNNHIWVCPRRHEWEATYSGIQRGNGCPHCSGRARKTIEDAEALAKRRGFRFLSSVFAGGGRKHRWQCSKKHEWEAKYHDIQQGTGCPYCAGKARRTIEDARALAQKRGFRFLSPAMAGSLDRYLWQCSDGHKWEAPYGNIQQGSGCPHCAGTARKTIEDAKALAKARGFLFLSSAFAGVSRKYPWRCSRGHEWQAEYNSIRQGRGCPQCARGRRGGKPV